jgi:Xaa-Pro aminopeptidase
MYQTFEVRGNPDAAATRLPKLRDAMQRLGVDGLLVPHDDEYLNEYTPPQFERLMWATGFSGSAGALLVTPDSAVLFIDSRYTEQARIETPAALFEYEDFRGSPPWLWLKKNPGRVTRLGYASELHTRDEIQRIESTDYLTPVELVALNEHPIDELWTDRPAANALPPVPHGIEYSGEDSSSKRARVAAKLGQLGTDATVFVNPNSTAWLLNLRGGDVPNTPVALCRSVLRADGSATLFLAGQDVSEALKAHLGPEVEIADGHAFEGHLQQMGADGLCVLVNSTGCPDFVSRTLENAGAKLREGDDPVIQFRSIKNPIEIEGARKAHAIDGVAMVKFLHWLDDNWNSGVSEIDTVRKLEAFRAEDDAMRGISFETISGSGPNGAIIHYRVSEASNRGLEDGDIYLVDSGGQYQGGTTDTTRTVGLGEQSQERKDRFTRVLQGHVALASARFPPGTCGYQLDMLARQPLWNVGCDYAHGTGHGVGTFLGVHEGPQGIAKKAATAPFEIGMNITIEPGFYVDGDYGIRIENIYVVRESAIEGMFEFETLTLAPIDKSLIDTTLLSDSEIDWLNNYHAKVWSALSPRLPESNAAWLKQATSPI